MKLKRASGGLSSAPFSSYESIQFTVLENQTNYDVLAATGKPSATARSFEIRAFTACTIRLNDITNDEITFAAGEQKTFDNIPVSNIFVTTTAEAIIRIVSYR
jgi:hypothetical protein